MCKRPTDLRLLPSVALGLYSNAAAFCLMEQLVLAEGDNKIWQ